jgi:tetratricopeptide (TPR) repeat protein
MRVSLYSAVFVASFVIAGSALASGSEEKSPEEKANENSRKATAIYNDAVKRIDHAKEIGLKGDSLYAYNYRATSDAKIRHEYEQAVKDLNKAVGYSPELKEGFNNLGYCYRKLGKLDESLAAYDKAIALDSNFAQAREYRGETYLALGKLSDAEKELAFLKSLKSPLAEQLAKSIEIFKLQEIEKAANPSGK